MSKFYIMGTNKELKNKHQTFSYEKLNVDFLKSFNDGYLNESFHYLINFLTNYQIGYDIKNFYDFKTDNDKLLFIKFLREIEELLISGFEISFYQFWDNSQTYDLDENHISQVKEISTNPEDLIEDSFSFNFNTKYIFIQN